MTKPLFSVTGNKISSLLLDDNSLKFSSQDFKSAQAFEDAWEKKLSLATKIEIKYPAIKSIHQEDGDKEVVVRYKSALGIPASSPFSFDKDADCQQFFAFLEQNLQFSKAYEAMSPFKAALNYLIGFLATVAITALSYFEAIAIANGTADTPTTGKSRAFYSLLELLGDKGVLAVGGLLAGWLLYKTVSRFLKPPHHQLFLPLPA